MKKRKLIYSGLIVLTFPFIIIYYNKVSIRSTINWVEENGGTFEKGQNKTIKSFPKWLQSLATSIIGESITKITLNSPNDIKSLKNVVTLEELSLSGEFVKDFSVLKKLNELQVLNISNANIDIKDLKTLTKLKKLHLRQCKIQNIDFISNLNILESLRLINSSYDSNISFLGPLRKLKLLEIKI